jgi:ribonuclease Z
VNLTLAGQTIDAVSIGGIETCIGLPGLGLSFDLGRTPDSAVGRDTVLFTHSHMDHLGGVAWHCATRSLRRMPPPTYVLGPEDAPVFQELVAVWRKLDRSGMAHRMVVVGPGERWDLNPQWQVRPFRALHVVPCQGYGLWHQKKKLRPEFQGLAGEAIRELRGQGVEVTRLVESPEVVFCGDTRIEVVEREEVVRTARLLILECTFIDDEVSVAEARSMGHVHLYEIAERAQLFANETVLLTHFSPRFRKEEVLAALARRLPESLRTRVVPLLP